MLSVVTALLCIQSISCSTAAQETGNTRGIESKFFYSKNTDGSVGYTIIFSLSNYTKNPITAIKVEVLDGTGVIKRSIDESALKKTSCGGIIEKDKSLSLSHKTFDLPGDIKEWTVRWQYADSNGELSTISGNHFDRK